MIPRRHSCKPVEAFLLPATIRQLLRSRLLPEDSNPLEYRRH
jgi:hypothetical protein